MAINVISGLGRKFTILPRPMLLDALPEVLNTCGLLKSITAARPLATRIRLKVLP